MRVGGVGSKPLSVTFRRPHSTKRPTCYRACSSIVTVWTCSSGVARLTDIKAISVFQHHCTHPVSYRFCSINLNISVFSLLRTTCTMERGLSSESNSVSGPPSPSKQGFIITHFNFTQISKSAMKTIICSLIRIFAR